MLSCAELSETSLILTDLAKIFNGKEKSSKHPKIFLSYFKSLYTVIKTLEIAVKISILK